MCLWSLVACFGVSTILRKFVMDKWVNCRLKYFSRNLMHCVQHRRTHTVLLRHLIHSSQKRETFSKCFSSSCAFRFLKCGKSSGSVSNIETPTPVECLPTFLYALQNAAAVGHGSLVVNAMGCWCCWVGVTAVTCYNFDVCLRQTRIRFGSQHYIHQ